MALLFADLPTLLILINIAVALIASAFEFLCVVELDDKLYRWLKILYGILCLYWVAVYIVIFASVISGLNFAEDPSFGKTFLRPGITYTLALIMSGAIYRYRILKSRKKMLKEANDLKDSLEEKRKQAKEEAEKTVPIKHENAE